MSVSSHLRNVTALYKREARKRYRSQNTVEDRIERQALILQSDFIRCIGVPTGVIDALVSHVQQLHVEHSSFRDLHLMLAVQKGLRGKRSINLPAALVLGGGGQRPQVLAQLELP
jgi:hypothetical protein